MKQENWTIPGPSNDYPTLAISAEVAEAIRRSVGALPSESGGPLGGSDDDTAVQYFHFDERSRATAATYSPDHVALNQLFRDEWNPRGIRLRGFVHSHPGRMHTPSAGDEVYAREILNAIPDLSLLWLPIVNSIAEAGFFRLTPWAAVRAGDGVRIVRAKVSVNGGDQLDELLEYPDAAKDGLTPVRDEGDQTFSRVVDAYDLGLMRGARLVVVGTGGAASFLEDVARAGIEQFVLIDPDVVTQSNIATQQVYRRDIGRKKVDCIAERLRDINPRVVVRTFAASIDDLTDNEIADLCSAPLGGRESKRSVLCGFTDAFAAQARVNLLGLQLGVPTVCAQVYLEGRGAEVTFTYPGMTPACHRCVLSSRYRFFLDQQRNNPVTSHGTPIFATGRLNAIKGFIVLALLHHGSMHPRWGGLLARIANRNLVQIRLDPDIQKTVGLTIFDRVFSGADQGRLLFDEAVWLPQNPESPRYGYPACPDCGGVGDLDSLIGTIGDTQRRLTAMQRGKAEVRHEAIH